MVRLVMVGLAFLTFSCSAAATGAAAGRPRIETPPRGAPGLEVKAIPGLKLFVCKHADGLCILSQPYGTSFRLVENLSQENIKTGSAQFLCRVSEDADGALFLEYFTKKKEWVLFEAPYVFSSGLLDFRHYTYYAV